MAGKPPSGGSGVVPGGDPGARPKQRGGRVVPLRYTGVRRESGSEETSHSVLQSTLLDSHGTGRPDLEFSAIKDKTLPGTSCSKINVKGSGEAQQTLVPSSTEDLIDMLDSQTLLLTYASLKMEKNLVRLEEEAERNLLTLCEEAEKLQREAHKKKCSLARMKRDGKLCEALSRQLEAAGPIAEQCARFSDQYKHFATALDSTRHELPVKEIHMEEDKSQFLADLQKELAATRKALNEAPQEHSESNAKALGLAKELEASSLRVDAELLRTFTHILDLSADVSKEVSLHSQTVFEDTLGLEMVKRLYFS